MAIVCYLPGQVRGCRGITMYLTFNLKISLLGSLDSGCVCPSVRSVGAPQHNFHVPLI
jgi:hypothetical protein